MHLTVIRRAEHEYFAPDFVPLAERPAALYPHVATRPTPETRPTATARGVKLHAEINHGRWVVCCPEPGCGGAVVASPDDRRFYCPYCLNDAHGNRFIRVIFPEKVLEIELLLSPRAESNRNWKPGETLNDLRRENEENGL